MTALNDAADRFDVVVRTARSGELLVPVTSAAVLDVGVEYEVPVISSRGERFLPAFSSIDRLEAMGVADKPRIQPTLNRLVRLVADLDGVVVDPGFEDATEVRRESLFAIYAASQGDVPSV